MAPTKEMGYFPKIFPGSLFKGGDGRDGKSELVNQERHPNFSPGGGLPRGWNRSFRGGREPLKEIVIRLVFCCSVEGNKEGCQAAGAVKVGRKGVELTTTFSPLLPTPTI